MKDRKAYQDNICETQNFHPDQLEKDLSKTKKGATSPQSIYIEISKILLSLLGFWCCLTCLIVNLNIFNVYWTHVNPVKIIEITMYIGFSFTQYKIFLINKGIRKQ